MGGMGRCLLFCTVEIRMIHQLEDGDQIFTMGYKIGVVQDEVDGGNKSSTF